jgi:hypothetical protein
VHEIAVAKISVGCTMKALDEYLTVYPQPPKPCSSNQTARKKAEETYISCGAAVLVVCCARVLAAVVWRGKK